MLKILLCSNLFFFIEIWERQAEIELDPKYTCIFITFSCDTENMHLIPPSWYGRVEDTHSLSAPGESLSYATVVPSGRPIKRHHCGCSSALSTASLAMFGLTHSMKWLRNAHIEPHADREQYPAKSLSLPTGDFNLGEEKTLVCPFP